MQLSEKTSGKRRDGKERCEMALKIEKEFFGVVMSPRREDVYDNGGGVLYPRVVELHHAGEKNGMLLATFDYYTVKEPPVAPIYCSTDHGKTWEPYSQVEDTKNGYGIRFQPVLFELPVQCGDLPAGTIVFAGNSIPLDFKTTELLFYISRDQGKTWEYRSSIAAGGPPIEQNFEELGPVWEPFIYLNAANELTVVFTDERPHTDRSLNQTLAVTSSKDGGKTWENEHLVVAIPDGMSRPGMAIVTKLPNGKYFMCYEIVCFPEEGDPYFDVHCRMSDDGMDFGDPAFKGTRIETADGFYLMSMPYCLWVPQGGENGTIIVSAKRDGDALRLRDPGDFLVNYHLGEGPWERVPMLVNYDSSIGQAGWSMGMCTIQNGTKLLQLAPTQMDTRMLQISYGIGVLKSE